MTIGDCEYGFVSLFGFVRISSEPNAKSRTGMPSASARGMNPAELRARTKTFAVQVIRFAKTSNLSGAIEMEIARQLTAAAGGTAAGYRAVCRARTTKDFIYKLGNTIEEVDEAALWLEVLIESEITPTFDAKRLWKEADELTRILVQSRETTRRNQAGEGPRLEGRVRPADRR